MDGFNGIKNYSVGILMIIGFAIFGAIFFFMTGVVWLFGAGVGVGIVVGVIAQLYLANVATE